ncbi:hypothetical protein KIH86_23050 [Paenibacillus sp. HN-1]|uniref:hypothetical protein n=1 Tax=Paenibacillus TaxID=44249 RepID=UPI001CA8CD6D|nr:MULTISPECIES: hypothetical protein [Paenibacillus]MBY9081034.1 hypothetical protein [Paenibacillus sp. CGMCC 1.18879]MBY9087071.1 hypothetical protein [Paenibacillus sinensis]
MNDHAKFTGELAKGIKIGESSVEVKLLIPLKAALPHLLFLSSNQGEEINVFLGDLQAAFDFGDDQEEVFKPVPGHRVTTDGSGVVTNVEKQGVGDSNQGELTFQEGEGGLQPGWLSSDEGDESTEEGQTGETSDGQEEGSDEGEGAGVSEPASDPEVSKEELEEFILRERPIFPEIEYQGEPIPFPDLLDKHLREDKTWREIANERDMTSGQLSSKWSAYRKLAAKRMNGDGGAA